MFVLFEPGQHFRVLRLSSNISCFLDFKTKPASLKERRRKKGQMELLLSRNHKQMERYEIRYLKVCVELLSSLVIHSCEWRGEPCVSGALFGPLPMTPGYYELFLCFCSHILFLHYVFMPRENQCFTPTKCCFCTRSQPFG